MASRKDRLAQVCASISEAGSAGAKLVVLPGWALFSKADLQNSLFRKVVRGLVVLVEVGISRPDRTKGFAERLYVVKNGILKNDTSPMLQRLSTGGAPNSCVEKLRKDINERRLNRGGRTLYLDGYGKVLVLLCGETGIRRNVDEWQITLSQSQMDAFEKASASARCIVNPGHTPRTPKGSRDGQRGWASLTMGGLLFSATNVLTISSKSGSKVFSPKTEKHVKMSVCHGEILRRRNYVIRIVKLP